MQNLHSKEKWREKLKKENNLREALIEQMEQNSSRTPNINQKSAQAIIAKETARLRVITRLVRCSWLLLILCLAVAAVIAAVVRSINAPALVIMLMISQLFLLIAVGLTVWHWAMSRTISMRQIQAALSTIQEQLEKMSQDK
jgi:hypothetical protein